MSDPSDEVANDVVVVPVFLPGGDMVLRAVPRGSAEANEAPAQAPLRADTATQMEQAARWRQMRAEADPLAGMLNEGLLATQPLIPRLLGMDWLGSPGHEGRPNPLAFYHADPSDPDQRWLEMQAFREEHPFLRLLPQLGMDVAAAAVSGGATGIGEMLGMQMASRLGGGIGARILTSAGGMAVDGGIAAMLQAAQDAQLDEQPLTVEQIAAAGGMGAALGGGMGALFGPFVEVPPSGVARLAERELAAGAGSIAEGGDLVTRARNAAQAGMQDFSPELGDPTAFTRMASGVSRIDEPALRRVAAWGPLPDEQVAAASAASRAARGLEEWIPNADRQLSEVLENAPARQQGLRNIFRYGQDFAGVNDAAVGRHVFDALQTLDSRWTAEGVQNGLGDVERTALHRLQLGLQNAREALGLTRGAGPQPVSAAEAAARLDQYLEEVRRIPNAGNLGHEVEMARETVTRALGDEAFFGPAGRTYRQLQEVLYEPRPGMQRRPDAPMSWVEARQRLRARLSEGGTRRGPLAVGAGKLRQLLAPAQLGDAGVWDDLALARRSYQDAQEVARRFTGREFTDLDTAWHEVAGDLGEARARALATRDKAIASDFERRNAGAFAAAGLSGAFLGAVGGGAIGGPLGALAGTAVGLAFTALSHPVQALSVMSHLGKLARGTAARTESAVSRLRTTVKSGTWARRIRRAAPAVPVTLARLTSRASRVREYERVTGELRHLVGNPEAMRQHLENTFGPVAAATSPAVADQLMVQAVRASEFLVAALPVVDQPAFTLFPADAALQPSDGEINDFLVKYQVAVDPLSAVEDAASGNLTIPAAETLRVIYPALFAEVQASVLDSLRGLRNPPYAVANQVSLLLNAPADVSHTEQFVYRMQQTYAQTTQQHQAQHSPRGSVRVAQWSATQSQSVEARIR